MRKSPDAFRTINEVAQDLDLPQHVLRFWETRFSQIKPMKRGGGRRYYRPDDIDLLKGIRHLLYDEGYTIKGVQKILKEQGIRHVIDSAEAVEEADSSAEIEDNAGQGAEFAPDHGQPQRQPHLPQPHNQPHMQRSPDRLPQPRRETGHEMHAASVPEANRPRYESDAGVLAQQVAPLQPAAAQPPQSVYPSQQTHAVPPQPTTGHHEAGSLALHGAPEQAIEDQAEAPQERAAQHPLPREAGGPSNMIAFRSGAKRSEPAPGHPTIARGGPGVGPFRAGAEAYQPSHATAMQLEEQGVSNRAPAPHSQPHPASRIDTDEEQPLPPDLRSGDPKFLQGGSSASLSIEEERLRLLHEEQKAGFFSRIMGTRTEQGEQRPAGSTPGALSRDEVRRLQSTLFELLECKRILDQTISSSSD